MPQPFNRRTRCLPAVLAAAALSPVLLAACASPDTDDVRFGAAVRLAVAQQTVDPQAAARLGAPEGMDGASARSALQLYQQSFATPAPRSDTYTIGVGSGK